MREWSWTTHYSPLDRFWAHWSNTTTFINVSSAAGQKLWLYSQGCHKCDYEKVGDLNSALISRTGKFLKIFASPSGEDKFRLRTDGEDEFISGSSEVYDRWKYCDSGPVQLIPGVLYQIRSDPTISGVCDVTQGSFLPTFSFSPFTTNVLLLILWPLFLVLLLTLTRRFLLLPVSADTVTNQEDEPEKILINKHKSSTRRSKPPLSTPPQPAILAPTVPTIPEIPLSSLEVELSSLKSRLQSKDSEHSEVIRLLNEDFQSSYFKLEKSLYDEMKQKLIKKESTFEKKLRQLEKAHQTQLSLVKQEYKLKYTNAEKKFEEELESKMAAYRTSQMKQLHSQMEQFKEAEIETFQLANKILESFNDGFELGNALSKFSESLIPPREFKENVHWASNLIFNILKHQSPEVEVTKVTEVKVSVDRVIIGGGIGKATAIRHEDYQEESEIVIFLNDPTPFFEKEVTGVLAAFTNFNKKFLDEPKAKEGRGQRRSSEVKFKVQLVSDCSIRFEYRNILFELLPAINFPGKFGASSTTAPSMEDGGAEGGEGSKGQEKKLSKRQFKGTLDQMKKFRGPALQTGYYGSRVSELTSSMAEFATEFVKCQSDFTRDLIRLAKFWNVHVKLGESKEEEKNFVVTGRSYMIELIVIFALGSNRMEEVKENKDLIEGMKYFLELMKDLKNLCIIFEQFYDRKLIPQSILRMRPLILDPVCPYHNLGLFRKNPKINNKIVLQFQHKAELALVKLESVCRSRVMDLKEIEEIFK